MPDLERRFNHDLLMTEADQHNARLNYADVLHVLDNPELRSEFQKYEDEATRHKRRVQVLGLAAVIASAFALLFAAARPLMLLGGDAVPESVHTAGFVAEALGLAAAAVSIGGVLMGRQKRRWLESRMMAEALRCWHFQSFICCGRFIEQSCNGDPDSVRTFREERTKLLAAFLHEWTAAADSYLEDLVDMPQSQFELFHDEPAGFTKPTAALDAVFRAYRVLRFKHQEHFAGHKLKRTTDTNFLEILRCPSAVLQRRAESASAACLSVSLLASLVVVFGHMAGLPPSVLAIASGVIIVFTVFNVATRAIQDGLAAPQDLQRYHEYHETIRHLLTLFDRATDANEKLEMMREMERAAIGELRGFLRAHCEARFVV